MARKRIISPEIWESDSFGSLSVLGKVLYIGMISLADDEGRGRANSALLKAKILPYNEEVRIADVEKALIEISAKTSTELYEVERTKYYAFNKWKKWQYIEKPRPSYLPTPPSCREGGDIPNTQEIGEQSGNNRGIVGEKSPPNTKEKKGIEIKERKCVKKENLNTHTFEKPTLSEIKDYAQSIGCPVNIDKFYSFYESNEWTVNGEPIRDWKARLNLWWHGDKEKKEKEQPKQDKFISRSYDNETLNGLFESEEEEI